MVQTFSSYRADQAFHVRALPWRSRSAEDSRDIHDLDLVAEPVAVDAVAIPKQGFRCSVERKWFEHLLRRPFGGRMRGDVEVDNTPAIMSENDKDEQNFEPDGVDCEEIDGSEL